MKYSSKARESRVAIALGHCAASVKRADGARWEFSLVNGKPLGVSARLVEDWLLFEAPISDRITRGGWWDVLRLNATIPGLNKFVLMSEAGADSPTDARFLKNSGCGSDRQTEVCRTLQNVHLRADIPLPQDYCESDCPGAIEAALITRVLETCAGLKTAYRSFRGEENADHQPPAAEHFGDSTEQRIDELRRLCGDTGWSFIERLAGKLMIDLEVRSVFYQAAVGLREAGAEIVVEIVSSEALSETSRQALSLLLLGTGALVRLARPSVVQKENYISVRYEVRFNTMPTAIELAHAFSSLSVACALSGREARALQDEVMAGDYLAILGPQDSCLSPLTMSRSKQNQERSGTPALEG